MTGQLKNLFQLDPEVIFLNHGSFGACPTPVFQVYQEWQRRLERQPVAFLGREFSTHLRQARQSLGEYLNADADDLAFVPNATHGVNIIAHSLDLKAGDEILTTNHEYGACDYTWEFYCSQVGACYRRQPLPLHPSEDDVIRELAQGIRPTTRLIYLSHITSPTALCLPIEATCRLAQQAGIPVLVDGAHAPGQLDLDLTDLGADFYTGSCHKWMLSPKGAGFLYTRRQSQHLIKPLVVSWGYHAAPESTTGARFVDYLEWTGTHDPSAALSVPAAIQFMKDHNWAEVRRACHRLLNQTLPQISKQTGLPSVYPGSPDLHQQMAVVALPDAVDLPLMKRRLYDEYHIEVPLIEWNGYKLARLSVQGYNSAEDLAAFSQALADLLP